MNRSERQKPSDDPLPEGWRKLFKPTGPLLFRAPILPVEAFVLASRNLSTESPVSKFLANLAPLAPNNDCDWIRLALSTASTSVAAALHRAEHIEAKVSDFGAIQRYAVRMATRPTPFGFFAGVALVQLSSHTNVTVSDSEPIRAAHPDLAWLLRLAAQIQRDPHVRQQLKCYANPRAYVRAEHVVLAEQAPAEEVLQGHEPAVPATAIVRHTMSLAKNPIQYLSLKDALLQRQGATPDKVDRFLSVLFDSSFLLTELWPCLESNPSVEAVALKMTRLQGAEKYVDEVARIIGLCDKIKNAPPAEAVRAIKELSSPTRKFGITPTLQMDLKIPLRNTSLNGRIADEVARAAAVMLALSPFPHGPPRIAAFKAQFLSRYEQGQEVRVIDVLDGHIGLGPYSAYGQDISPLADRLDRRGRILLRLAQEAALAPGKAIRLTTGLINTLQTVDPTTSTIPRSLDVNFFISSKSSEDIDTGNYRIVIGPNAGAMGAGRNIGRFAHLLGDEALTALRHSARAEAILSPNSIDVELVYLPLQFKSANVAVRPRTRQYKLAIGGYPGDDPDRSIPLEEIYVGIVNEKFYLRWARTGQYIRLTSGHMLTNIHAPELCKFLTEVNADGLPQLSLFDWGPAEHLPYLPRVEFERTILRSAQWRLRGGPIIDLDTRDRRSFTESFREWSERWKIPQRVFVAESDNRLLVDLQDEGAVDDIYREYRQLPEGRTLLLQEVVPALDECWVRGLSGSYYAEFVVSLLRIAKGPVKPGAPDFKILQPSVETASSIGLADRVKAFGSEWLFVKAYVGEEVQNDLLLDFLGPILRKWQSAGRITQWFFIRYSDPEPHLRIRILASDQVLVRVVTPKLGLVLRKAIESDYCRKFSFDTYFREIERYEGLAGISPFEDLFCADSNLALTYLAKSRSSTESEMERLCVGTLTSLFRALGVAQSELIQWLRTAGNLKNEASEAFRRDKDILRLIVAEAHGAESSPKRFCEAQEIIRASRERHLQFWDRPQSWRSKRLSDIAHLHCNRLIGVDARREKRVLGLLLRTLESVNAAPFEGFREIH